MVRLHGLQGLVQANYSDNTDAELYSPNYNFTAAGIYTLRFFRKLNVETGFDGFIVEYSTDKGNLWTPLGVLSAGWYDYQTAGLTAFPSNQPFFNVNQGELHACAIRCFIFSRKF